MTSVLHFTGIGLVSLADPVHLLVIIAVAVAAPRWHIAAMLAAVLAVIIQAAIGWAPVFSEAAVVFVTLAAVGLNVGIVKWRSAKAGAPTQTAEATERQSE